MGELPTSEIEGTARALRILRAGDAPEAREMLARRAAQLALRTASALTSSRDLADEVSQDVAVEVLRSIHKLRDENAFDAWVHRITVRRAKKVVLNRSNRRRRELPLALQTREPENHSPEIAELVSLRAALGVALADLPDRQLLAIALRYIHDLSDEDIAAALGAKVGTVHALLSRARSALRNSDELALFAPTKEATDVGPV